MDLAMTADAIAAQTLADGVLGFAVKSLSRPGGPVIHLADGAGTDADVGRVRIVLQNNAGAKIVLNPDSRLSIAFPRVLTHDETAHVAVAGSDWENPPTAEDTTLTLRPRGVITIDAGRTLDVDLDKVLASGMPRTRRLTIDYSGIEGVADGNMSLMVFVQHPASFQRELDLSYAFLKRPEYGADDSGNTIYRNPPGAGPDVKNTLVLTLANPSPDLPIAVDPAVSPRFIVSFVEGGGRGALGTRIGDIDVTVEQGDPARPWTAVKETEAGTTTFTLQPPAGSTELFDDRVPALVSFRFETIITTAEAGATMMYIQHAGVPHYDDGYSSPPTPIQKLPLLEFVATAGGKVLNDGDAVDWGPLTFSWTAYGAGADSRGCSLLQDGAAVGADDTAKPAGQATITPPVQLKDPVSYTFTAHTSPPAERDLRLAFRPVITQFDGVPQQIYPQQKLVLTWACAGGNSCDLTGPGAALTGLPISHSLPLVVPDMNSGPVAFELICHGANGLATRRRIDTQLVSPLTVWVDVGSQTSTVHWQTVDATSVTLARNFFIRDPIVEPVELNGARAISLQGNPVDPWNPSVKSCTVTAIVDGRTISREVPVR
jgi:hypothetical protein